jgi:hypothetical protein
LTRSAKRDFLLQEFQPDIPRGVVITVPRAFAGFTLKLLSMAISVANKSTLSVATLPARVSRVNVYNTNSTCFELVGGEFLDFFEQPLLVLGLVAHSLTDIFQVFEHNMCGSNLHRIAYDAIRN